MPLESDFVSIALTTAQLVLAPPLTIKQGQPLLYEIMVDDNLVLTVDPKRPVRGDSAFRTDFRHSAIRGAGCDQWLDAHLDLELSRLAASIDYCAAERIGAGEIRTWVVADRGPRHFPGVAFR